MLEECSATSTIESDDQDQESSSLSPRKTRSKGISNPALSKTCQSFKPAKVDKVKFKKSLSRKSLGKRLSSGKIDSTPLQLCNHDEDSSKPAEDNNKKNLKDETIKPKVNNSITVKTLGAFPAMYEMWKKQRQKKLKSPCKSNNNKLNSIKPNQKTVQTVISPSSRSSRKKSESQDEDQHFESKNKKINFSFSSEKKVTRESNKGLRHLRCKKEEDIISVKDEKTVEPKPQPPLLADLETNENVNKPTTIVPFWRNIRRKSGRSNVSFSKKEREEQKPEAKKIETSSSISNKTIHSPFPKRGRPRKKNSHTSSETTTVNILSQELKESIGSNTAELRTFQVEESKKIPDNDEVKDSEQTMEKTGRKKRGRKPKKPLSEDNDQSLSVTENEKEVSFETTLNTELSNVEVMNNVEQIAQNTELPNLKKRTEKLEEFLPECINTTPAAKEKHHNYNYSGTDVESSKTDKIPSEIPTETIPTEKESLDNSITDNLTTGELLADSLLTNNLPIESLVIDTENNNDINVVVSKVVKSPSEICDEKQNVDTKEDENILSTSDLPCENISEEEKNEKNISIIEKQIESLVENVEINCKQDAHLSEKVKHDERDDTSSDEEVKFTPTKRVTRRKIQKIDYRNSLNSKIDKSDSANPYKKTYLVEGVSKNNEASPLNKPILLDATPNTNNENETLIHEHNTPTESFPSCSLNVSYREAITPKVEKIDAFNPYKKTYIKTSRRSQHSVIDLKSAEKTQKARAAKSLIEKAHILKKKKQKTVSPIKITIKTEQENAVRRPRRQTKSTFNKSDFVYEVKSSSNKRKYEIMNETEDMAKSKQMDAKVDLAEKMQHNLTKKQRVPSTQCNTTTSNQQSSEEVETPKNDTEEQKGLFSYNFIAFSFFVIFFIFKNTMFS